MPAAAVIAMAAKLRRRPAATNPFELCICTTPARPVDKVTSRPDPSFHNERGAPKARLDPVAIESSRSPGRRSLLTLELLAGFLGAPLQLVLELLLLLLEYFRIGRRAVVGLGEVNQRNHQADRLIGAVA